jgi:hypothetical protein
VSSLISAGDDRDRAIISTDLSCSTDSPYSSCTLVEHDSCQPAVSSSFTDALCFSAVPCSCGLLQSFHGGNTGSNPVGDAKSFQQLGAFTAKWPGTLWGPVADLLSHGTAGSKACWNSPRPAMSQCDGPAARVSAMCASAES